jgi:uncharacterized membrane protein
MENKNILTVEEVRRQHKPIRNVNIEHREKLSKVDRFAVKVTQKVGTIGFFFIILTWTILWLSWNVFAPIEFRFDPYPAFVLWLFISNTIQIMLMPLLLVGQNLQGRHSEARADADYEVNTQAEKEIETILIHLENQNKLILRILNHLEGEKK